MRGERRKRNEKLIRERNSQNGQNGQIGTKGNRMVSIQVLQTKLRDTSDVGVIHAGNNYYVRMV